MSRTLFLLAIILASSTCLAQDLTEKKSLSVFLDCNFCDLNHIRSNVDYIDYVREPELADIHILASRMRSGADAFRYVFDFIGKQDFDGEGHELTFSDEPNSTRQQRAQRITKKIETGLIPFWIRTGMSDFLSLKVKNQEPTEENGLSEAEDPWNSWFFVLEGGGSARLESRKQNFTYWGRVRGDKVTEEWRIRNTLYVRQQHQRFENDEEVIISSLERNFFNSSIVRSINDHFSAGILMAVSESTYGNLDLGTRIAPAFEYSIFPYSEVHRREVTLAYRFNQLYRDYHERTIYNQMEEGLWSQALVFSARFQQPWGSLFTQIEGSHFFRDFNQNRLEMNSRLSLRVTKGLALTLNGDFDIINDQRSLPAGEISFEDLLLSQRQIATNFRLSGSVGLRYTFGSMFNNVVNTRL